MQDNKVGSGKSFMTFTDASVGGKVGKNCIPGKDVNTCLPSLYNFFKIFTSFPAMISFPLSDGCSPS